MEERNIGPFAISVTEIVVRPSVLRLQRRNPKGVVLGGVD